MALKFQKVTLLSVSLCYFKHPSIASTKPYNNLFVYTPLSPPGRQKLSPEGKNGFIVSASSILVLIGAR